MLVCFGWYYRTSGMCPVCKWLDGGGMRRCSCFKWWVRSVQAMGVSQMCVSVVCTWSGQLFFAACWEGCKLAAQEMAGNALFKRAGVHRWGLIRVWKLHSPESELLFAHSVIFLKHSRHVIFTLLGNRKMVGARRRQWARPLRPAKCVSWW